MKVVADRANIEPLWFRHALLPDGWASDVRIVVSDGRIEAIEMDAPPVAGEAQHRLAIPGIPNVHSHAFQRGMAGLAEARGPGPDSFWSWRDAMYRFVDRLTPEHLQAVAAQAYVEMLESGFTRVGEFHYLHHDPSGAAYGDPAEMGSRIVAAAAATGIGLTLLPVFYAHADFGGASPAAAQRRFILDPAAYGRVLEASAKALSDLPDGRLGVAPHSLRAVTPDELAQVIRMTSGPIHMHVAEQLREVESCIAWSGQRPVAWLLDKVEVNPRWCLVHATHMTDAEVAGLARSGAVAGLCPGTEANLGDGIFPGRAYLAQGGRFAVGSDSNVLIDAAEELRLLEYSQRWADRARNVMATPGAGSTGTQLVHQSVRGGSQALGVDGGLRAGVSADIVSLDLEHPALIDRTPSEAVDSWIFAARPGAVEHVWRRGRKVVSHGRHAARDMIARRYSEVLRELLG